MSLVQHGTHSDTKRNTAIRLSEMTLRLGVEAIAIWRMHEVMGGGAERAVALIQIDEVLDQPGLVAVGAAENLDGEITIYDGTAILTRARSAGPLTVTLDTGTNVGAAYLTTSAVDAWQDVTVDRDLDPKAFEQFLASTAEAGGIDLSKPFPFVVKGHVAGLRAHVVKGACPMRPGAVIGEDQKPWVYEPLDRVAATVVGFRAAESVGNLTHPGTTLHAHAIFQVDGANVTGHVERMSVLRGALVRIPRLR